MYDLLTPGGRLILLVPAHQRLYSNLDRSLLHFRRYGRKDLTALLRGQGFEVEKLMHHNLVGALGWFWSEKFYGGRA